jgi:hypothetical protein
MSKNDPAFIQQHCVDAYGAQHSGGETKSITTAFSLVGLYLFLEHGYTGREVQQAHTTLGEQDRSWPELIRSFVIIFVTGPHLSWVEALKTVF